MLIVCTWCGKSVDKSSSSVNRARKIDAPLFCGRVCSGLHRRKGLTLEQKKANKSEYDRDYRDRNREKRKIKNAAWYQRTRDPEKERVYRKANMGRHIEYCRRPEYREKKRDYDRDRRAKEYGVFSDPYKILVEIEKEIRNRMTRFEVYQVNGRRYAQWRKRQVG